MNDYPLNIVLMGEVPDDARPVLLLKAMACTGKVGRFVHQMENCGVSWAAICAFEQDLIDFSGRNRWCGALDGWFIQVGRCEHLPTVPSYTEWGQVGAWVLYEDDWAEDYVLVFDSAGREVKVYAAATFYEAMEASVRCTAAFADDSAITMNRILKAF